MINSAGRETRPRVLIFHGNMRNLGGGEAVCAWVLQALKDSYGLTVLTWDSAGAEELNRVFGTTLAPEDFRVERPSPVVSFAFNLLARWRRKHEFQKMALLYRIARRRARHYAVCISTYDEIDFGRPGIQYVHFPGLLELKARSEPPRAARSGEGRSGRRWRRFRSAFQPWRLLSGFSFDGVERNMTLVNSRFTGESFRTVYGISGRVVYPPVHEVEAHTPWEARGNDFVCVGRLIPSKRIDTIIAMLAAVRACGHDVRLHVVGMSWKRATERRLYEDIEQLVAANASWVTLHADVSRAALEHIMGTCRYGIHAQVSEPFGIAPAEMVKAGCITFTGAVGGQTEIVGGDPRLVLDSVEDGISKIDDVLTSPSLQRELREMLAGRAKLFTIERFMTEIRAAVSEFSCGPDALAADVEQVGVS